MTAVTLNKLSIQMCSKNRTFQLDNIDISINRGELVVVVGPSGVGKSTLLRAIAGLEAVESGEIYFDDKRVDHLPTSERNVAMVFQSFSLYPHYNVEENLGLGLRIKANNKEDTANRVLAIAKKLKISHLLKSLPKTLSGGQKQRVAIGRALLCNPKVFLFDEPLSNLDPALRIELRREIHQLHNSSDAASIFVTHDQSEAFTLADRILLLSDKGIEQYSTPKEIYHSPDSLFAASFFGTPNLNVYSGHCEGSAVKLDIGLHWPLSLPEKCQGERVSLAIRPTKLFISETGTFRARIEHIERQIEVFWVTAKLEEADALVVFVSEKSELRVGQLVRLDAKLEDLMLFDSNGKAIR